MSVLAHLALTLCKSTALDKIGLLKCACAKLAPFFTWVLFDLREEASRADAGRNLTPRGANWREVTPRGVSQV